MCAMDREEFGRFVDGVGFPMYVVTAATDDERAGCLLTFAHRVSIDPPLFLVSISGKNRTCDVARRADHLAVHLLGPDAHGLAELFGGETSEDTDKFAGVGWREGSGGAPLLDDAPRVMVGRVLERYDWADHVGHLLEPVAVEVRGGEPGLELTDVDDIEPGHPA